MFDLGLAVRRGYSAFVFQSSTTVRYADFMDGVGMYNVYQTNGMLVTMVAANVSVLVFGSIPKGIALRAKLPLAWAY